MLKKGILNKKQGTAIWEPEQLEVQNANEFKLFPHFN